MGVMKDFITGAEEGALPTLLHLRTTKGSAYEWGHLGHLVEPG